MATTTDDKKIIYSMDRVSRSYGTKTVLKDISISYYYGAKIGVIGANGSGKSSLFKILAGVDTEFTGETSISPGYSIGYLEQEPELEAGKTVMEIVKEGKIPVGKFHEPGSMYRIGGVDMDRVMDYLEKNPFGYCHISRDKFRKAASSVDTSLFPNLTETTDASEDVKRTVTEAKETAAASHKADLEAFAADNEILKQITDLALLANGMLKGKELSDFIARSAKVVEDAYLK